MEPVDSALLSAFTANSAMASTDLATFMTTAISPPSSGTNLTTTMEKGKEEKEAKLAENDE
jgi:hypothetical protein